ncbi:MAG: hypothetical protein D9V47_04750 [Clostridia bacterium]|nr:MAG: hypothetical protein D9V47_04750 [Clostridia bacterium]
MAVTSRSVRHPAVLRCNRQVSLLLGRAAAEIVEPVEARVYTQEEIDLARLLPVSFLHHILTQP